jgi:hypothetical protein
MIVILSILFFRGKEKNKQAVGMTVESSRLI